MLFWVHPYYWSHNGGWVEVPGGVLQNTLRIVRKTIQGVGVGGRGGGSGKLVKLAGHNNSVDDPFCPSAQSILFEIIKILNYFFIFSSESSVQSHCNGQTDPVAVMGFLRTEKDNFKPPK